MMQSPFGYRICSDWMLLSIYLLVSLSTYLPTYLLIYLSYSIYPSKWMYYIVCLAGLDMPVSPAVTLFLSLLQVPATFSLQWHFPQILHLVSIVKTSIPCLWRASAHTYTMCARQNTFRAWCSNRFRVHSEYLSIYIDLSTYRPNCLSIDLPTYLSNAYLSTYLPV